MSARPNPVTAATKRMKTAVRPFVWRPFALARYRAHLSYKQFDELEWWRLELRRYVQWYRGQIPTLWGVPAPDESAKIGGSPVERSAVLTWINATIDDYYPRHLLLPKDYFGGKSVLDIGCGPLPYVTCFHDCAVYGLDQLIDPYARLGFPIDAYPERLTYVNSGAENIPVENDYFDAVISVNAIDHVDDLRRAGREIARVLRPDGIVRFEIHYHEPTKLEPQSLDDESVMEQLGHLGIKKVCERPYSELWPPPNWGTLTVWSNRP